MHRSEQTEVPRRKGQVEPPVHQREVSTLVPVDAREDGRSARSRLPYGKTRRRKKTQNAWYSSGTFKTIDLNKKASTHKKDKNCTTS